MEYEVVKSSLQNTNYPYTNSYGKLISGSGFLLIRQKNNKLIWRYNDGYSNFWLTFPNPKK